MEILQEIVDAEASSAQAIALKPDFAEAHYNLGNTLEELGRLEEAEASYAQAIELKPDYAEAHSNLGKLLMKLGKHSQGLREQRIGGGVMIFDLKYGLSTLKL